jgi:1-aminocyclopropane-1-carboxylate deaminase/D-cysteine desulfhydrase-like pyridoxal-dependent ACC family enzyme
MRMTRRRFVQGAALSGAALAAARYSLRSRSLPPWPEIALPPGLTPPIETLAAQPLALARIFPSAYDPDATEGPLFINTLKDNRGRAGYSSAGAAGNAVFFDKRKARPVIPWTPLFVREYDIRRLPRSVTASLGGVDLLIANESSAHYPIYGNKARKYEFLLPNLHWSGVKRVSTLGAATSNHALQFAIANRAAALTGAGERLESDLDLVLFEPDGVPTNHTRLHILQSLAHDVLLTKNMVDLAGEAAYAFADARLHANDQVVVPPGGSNELSVLGHINAMAELAQTLQMTQEWGHPPDIIFVAMGSGATVLGMVLGVRLLGWKTQIIGVADQDRSYFLRFVANQRPHLPFVEGNVVKLAQSSLEWLRRIRFPGLPENVEHLLRRDVFWPDSSSWPPGYGLVDAKDLAWRDALQANGVRLDPCFTLKAWRSIVTMAQSGALNNKKVLFWNTNNAFEYESRLLNLIATRRDKYAKL